MVGGSASCLGTPVAPVESLANARVFAHARALRGHTDDRDFHGPSLSARGGDEKHDLAVRTPASRPRILWSAAGRLRGRAFPVRAREGIVQAHARADLELGEHLLEVPLDGTGAEEQPGADLRIGETAAREAGDLLLLRRELVARLDSALAHLLGLDDHPRGRGEVTAP